METSARRRKRAPELDRPDEVRTLPRLRGLAQSDVPIGITHPVVRLSAHWIYRPRRRWLRFAHGENDWAVALPYLQF